MILPGRCTLLSGGRPTGEAMSFQVDERTLECLEWRRIREMLADGARTPGGREHCLEGDLFLGGADAIRDGLAETAEAFRLLADGGSPPIGGLVDLTPVFRRLRKGGALAARELLDLGSALGALHATERYLTGRREGSPRLADRAGCIGDQRDLAAEIEHTLDSEGQVRDSASSALRDARRETRQLSHEIERRLERLLQDTRVRAALSDRFHTMRNDRYVLPVRSEARSAVPGIVHDASGSGTTVFIEPAAVVDLNNRLKSAELTVQRETLRVLRDLSSRAAASLDDIEASLAILEGIDAVFCRGRMAQAQGAVEPEVGADGTLRLPQLRHPLIPAGEVVPSDLAIGEHYQVLVVSGPNAGGKTVAMKAVGLAALMAHAGCFVPCDPGARVDALRAVVADIGDDQDIARSLSTFSAHMATVARIVDAAGPGTLVVLDEIGTGTDPGEGAALAQSVLETLAEEGARVVTTTHFNLLKEMAAVDPRFENASVEFDPTSLAPTYRLRVGTPGVSSATTVAARMGVRGDVLERAEALLQREDRRLDRMLSELSASRLALEAEQREASRLRAESEATRSEYRARLERLQERRDKIFSAMKDDLENAFRDAHGQVAAVIRDLQRGGTARDAAHARDRLLVMEEKTRAVEAEHAIAPSEPPGEAMDWQRARPGDSVLVVGAGPASLDALPDRRGRAAVRVASGRMMVPAERVRALAPAAEARPKPAVPQRPASGGTAHCDLRGLRVDEALDRMLEALDRAAGDGRDCVEVIHGHGTGALRDAVREQLRGSPYVASFAAGSAEEGGDGVTRVELKD
ncbi:MAG: Smr/MutS family protein [Deltaproteobacteria bacterium]|nr:Smr/MutS family protein [Deltaproteobacteria bacterium]